MMNRLKKFALAAGILFILELVVHSVGSSLIEAFQGKEEMLLLLAQNSNRVITGILLEVLCALSLLVIGVLMYPVLERNNRILAVSYLALRIGEAILAMGFAVIHLALLGVSRQWLASGAAVGSWYQNMATLLVQNHGDLYLLYGFFYILGSSILFGGVLKYNLVPRFISLWGLIGAALMLVGLVADLYGSGIGMEFYASPLGLAQVVLGGYLIIFFRSDRGRSESAPPLKG